MKNHKPNRLPACSLTYWIRKKMTHKLHNCEEQTQISTFLMLNVSKNGTICVYVWKKKNKQKRHKRFKFHISHFVIDLVNIFPSKRCVRGSYKKLDMITNTYLNLMWMARIFLTLSVVSSYARSGSCNHWTPITEHKRPILSNLKWRRWGTLKFAHREKSSCSWRYICLSLFYSFMVNNNQFSPSAICYLRLTLTVYWKHFSDNKPSSILRSRSKYSDVK